MRDETKPRMSYSDALFELPPIQGDTFRQQLVRAQWNYVKAQLKKNENPRTLVETGDLYLLKNNYKNAIDYYQRSLVLNPDFILAYEKIILAYSLHRKYHETIPYFSRLLELTNNRVDILRKYAALRVNIFLTQNEGKDDAMRILDEALKLMPEDVELINTYGFILLNHFPEKLSEAKDYFSKALKINGEYIHSLNNLAVCYIKEGKWKEAEEILSKSIAITPPNYPHTHQNLALLLLIQQRFEEAYSVLEKAVKKGVPIENSAHHLMGWILLEMRDLKRALVWYEEKIKSEPGNELLLNNLGFCYGAFGEKEKSEKCFKQAVSISEDKIRRTRLFDMRALRGYYNLGRVRAAASDFKEVERISNRISELNPGDAFSIYLAGVSKVINEEYEEAKKFFSRTLALDETISDVYPDYAFIHECIDGNAQAAADLLEKGIALGFDKILINNNLAFAYIQLNQLDKAERILRRYTEPIPVILATRGLLEMRRGNLEEAEALYTKAISLFEGKNRKICTQIHLLEKARYFLKRNSAGKAQKLLREAKDVITSYLTPQIELLEIEANEQVASSNNRH